MNKIQAIETLYNGYKFRSRSEARWAVFFDTLNIKYLYEFEGYTLSSGDWYLPDFYLTESDTFFEVKGADDIADLSKIITLGNDLDKPVAVGYGDLTFRASSEFGFDCYALEDKGNSWIVQCQECKKYYFLGTSGGWGCRCCGHYDGDNTFNCLPISGDLGDMGRGWDTNEPVVKAITAARRARFEHGETPKIKNQFPYPFVD